MEMTSYIWSNLGLLFIFAFLNSRKITIQGVYKSIKFQKYIFVRALLVCFRNRRQGFPGYTVICEEKVGKVIKFLDTVGFHLQ